MEDIRWYVAYYQGKWKFIFLSIFLSLIQAASLLPVALFIKQIFDEALPQRNSNVLSLLLLLIFSLFLLNALATLLNRHISLRMVKSAAATMRNQLVGNMIHQARHYYTTNDLDSIHTTIVNDSERIDWMASALLTQFLPGFLIGLGLFLFLLEQNTLLCIIIVGALLLLYIIGKLIGENVRSRIKIFHRDFSRFSKGVLFILKFNELIKISTAEEKEKRRQNQNIEDLQTSSRKMAWLTTVYTLLQSNILLLAGIIVLLIGGMQVLLGSITVGELLSFYVALTLLSTNAGNVINALPIIMEGRQSLKDVRPLLKTAFSPSGQKTFSGFKKDISFKDVSFHHQDSNFYLKEVTFSIKKHQSFGLFGVSGSGKSTLVNLLLGFYLPTKGIISIDGMEIKDLEPIAYRQHIGVLPQDLHIFSGTVRENVTYGLSGISEAEMVAVCQKAQIHEEIQALLHGYETMIGEEGARLSGGQKQRLAIARALLRKPEILILDEPDNNLDKETTEAILKNIKETNITAIIISHNRDLKDFLDGFYEIK